MRKRQMKRKKRGRCNLCIALLLVLQLETHVTVLKLCCMDQEATLDTL
jgi:hypothetical protein